MSDARSAILASIRASLGGVGDPSAAPQASLPGVDPQVTDTIAAHAHGPRLRYAATDLATRFSQRALALGSSVERIDTLAHLPLALARYLEQNQLPRIGVCWPQFADLQWREAGIAVARRAAQGDDLLGITGAFCGLAETGTLMLLSSTTTPAATSLLPETHVAVLPASRIVDGMEEAWRLLREEHAAMPRAVNFVSGPSRTADIEQTIVIGAHGPYRVHIVVVGL